jgi:diaminohydroxyphosphoribosylaminopyrimidine deaminase/5-amino-6-(5-phosphoribosylamino)uracil reductase
MHDAPYARLMRRALRLARRGRGRVEPNPAVGCVLARGAEPIAEGHHEAFGQAHAEAAALQDAHQRGVSASGCDVYVTLEPCAHEGKTPPCADALIRAGVRRVFYAVADPGAPGAGAEKLRRAGVSVAEGLEAEAARWLNAGYFKRLEQGLPWLRLKGAMSVDGRIAASSGESRWITGPRSRRRVHALRGASDAVLVGVGTAQADDPMLTARDAPAPRTARRVVLDPRLRLSPESALARSAAAVPLTVATTEAAAQGDAAERLRALGAEVFAAPAAGVGGFALTAVLHHLAAAHEATHVLAEGGATTAGALLREGLVDELFSFVAPRLMGDEQAVPTVRGLEAASMAQVRSLRLLETRRLGEDVLLRYAVP